MKYSYTIQLGEYSGGMGGHEKIWSYIITCNKTELEIEEAFKKACLLSGIDFGTTFSDYEDNIVSDEVIECLYKIGIDCITFCDNDAEYNTVNSEGLTKLLLAMVTSQLPDFKYKIKAPPLISCMMGIGYGLLY